MFVRFLSNQRYAAGTIQFIRHRGVRQIYLKQGLIEELPDHEDKPLTKKKRKRKGDGNTDSNPDDTSPGLDSSDVKASAASGSSPAGSNIV